jgi:hypothetical protein
LLKTDNKLQEPDPCWSPSSNENEQSGCGCDSNSQRSMTACPKCEQKGMTVGAVTPRSTLKAQFRPTVLDEYGYNFCESAECSVVYYHDSYGQNDGPGLLFTGNQLINRVTVKDDDPATQLCYCFKVRKGEALDEIERTGTVDIKALINRRRKTGKDCFCEKSNPRGQSCSGDIRDWLAAQGIIVSPDDDICGCGY